MEWVSGQEKPWCEEMALLDLPSPLRRGICYDEGMENKILSRDVHNVFGLHIIKKKSWPNIYVFLWEKI